MSAFDPEQFLDAAQTEVNERRIVLPVENPSSSDGLYTAIIGEVKTESGTIGKGERVGEPWMSVVVPLKLELSPQVQELVKYNTFTLTDRVFIDLTPGGKGIDNAPGKNRGQKMYREAVDKNKPGDTFKWKTDVPGKVVKVKITHEMYNGFPQEKVSQILKG